MVNGKRFFENIWAVKGDSEYERYANDFTNQHLPLDMIIAARNYAPKKIDGEYVCGLNAFRAALTMIEHEKNERGLSTITFPEIRHYPTSWVLFIGTIGPDPQQYASFIDDWCRGGCGYIIRSNNWQEIENRIKTSLNNGKPVIALGSSGGYAHYFNIVGWGNQYVLVLDNGGRLHCAHRRYIIDFMNVSLPFASGFNIFIVAYNLEFFFSCPSLKNYEIFDLSY